MSLDLDRRQRAMLQEMGVRVWWPEASAIKSVSTVQVPEAAGAQAIVVKAADGPAAQAIVAKAARDGFAERNPATTRVPEQSPPSSMPETALATVAHDVANMDWPTLAQTIASCEACKLCVGRKAAVLAGGEAAGPADWLVVGDPPDEQEERLGAPFAGQSGQLLDNMLKAVGVSRRRSDGLAVAAAGAASHLAYVSHCVKCRPAIARNPELAELATCENYLRREVALVRPKVILALGRFAAQTLLQGSLPEVASIPLGKLRGQVYRYQQIPVIVSYPTSYLLRAPQDKARAWADLCLAMAAKAA